MASNAETAYEAMKAHIGEVSEPGEWFQVTQDQINKFADLTKDHQFIHVDPERSAKMSPYKVTVAHGFLTLSMLAHLSTSVKSKSAGAGFGGMIMGVNYGFDKIRFPSPVKVDSKIRVVRKLKSVDLKPPNSIQVVHECTIEVEGESKPSCVADWITRMFYS